MVGQKANVFVRGDSPYKENAAGANILFKLASVIHVASGPDFF